MPDQPAVLPVLAVGDRVWFVEERLAYTVQAVSPDGRWVAATKPFAARRTVLYTVIDRDRQVRGRDDHFGLGYETREACEAAIARFADGSVEHSRRHRPIPVRLAKVQRAGEVLTRG